MAAQTLREKIREKIVDHGDNPDQAALTICVLLDEELDLAGNGWFDKDKEVLAAIRGEGGEDDEAEG